MKRPTKLRREEMEKIIDTILANDSTPRMLMEASKENSSEEWDEAEEAKKCDSSVSDTLDNYEKAVEIIKSR